VCVIIAALISLNSWAVHSVSDNSLTISIHWTSTVYLIMLLLICL